MSSRILPWWAPVPRWNLGRRRLHTEGSHLHEGLSRRTVLRGLLQGSVVTVGLPPLLAYSSTARASTCANGFPRRFGMFFWGNGNRPDFWTPTGEGTDWSLSEELMPLAPVKDKISVVSGMSVKADNISPHWSGAIGQLTGRPLVGLDSDWDVAEPTIDQRLAQTIGGDTIYRSLEVGINTDRSMSWAGPSAQYPADEDPYHFYERIFGASFREPGDDGLPDPSLGWRRSVLDAVMGDIRTLQNKVGTEDKERLERHFDGIRDLETRLARLEEDPPSLESCSRADAPLESYPDIDGRPQLAARSRAFADLLAMSLACDQTRVFGFTFGYPVRNTLFPDASDGHHTLTHNEGGVQEQVHNITVQIITEYSYLLQALDAIPEGEGTLLDNCCVVATSDVSEGKTHSLDDIPLVIAGGACGALKTGVHYRSYSQENINKASLSILRGMGLTIESLGVDESRTTDGLSAIEGGLMRWTMLVGGLALGCAGADERAKDSGDGADASCEAGLTAVLVVSELGFTVPDESGNVAGFDLDGITSTDGDPAGCGHGDAVSPDGETGVDSAFAGLAPLLEGLGAGAVAGLVQGAVDSGDLLILVELTGLDGPLSPDLNDDCVTFTLHRGAGAPILGTDGRILVDQTFGKDTTYPSSGTVQGRIEGGHFRADNVDLSLPVQILDEFLVFNVASASFAFDMLEDGDVQGFFAGGVPVDELAGQIGAIDDLGGLQDVIPPLLESTADLFPDEAGECVELSIGFDMIGRPAFMLDEG